MVPIARAMTKQTLNTIMSRLSPPPLDAQTRQAAMPMVSSQPMIAIITTRAGRRSNGIHRASAPSSLTSPPPI
jgi:hypothetical protein